METYGTQAFINAFNAYRNPDIVRAKIELLQQDPGHPSLRTHSYRRSGQKGIRECYINNGDRLLYEMKGHRLYLWYLGPHELVEKNRCYDFSPNKKFYPIDLTPMVVPEEETPENSL